MLSNFQSWIWDKICFAASAGNSLLKSWSDYTFLAPSNDRQMFLMGALNKCCKCTGQNQRLGDTRIWSRDSHCGTFFFCKTLLECGHCAGLQTAIKLRSPTAMRLSGETVSEISLGFPQTPWPLCGLLPDLAHHTLNQKKSSQVAYAAYRLNKKVL